MRSIVTATQGHKLVVPALAILGLGAGPLLTALQPDVYSTSVLLVVSVNHQIQPQLVIVGSDPVLRAAEASKHAHITMTLPVLRASVRSAQVSREVMSVTALGPSPSQAQNIVTAVAASYVTYVDSRPPALGEGTPQAEPSAAPGPRR